MRDSVEEQLDSEINKNLTVWRVEQRAAAIAARLAGLNIARNSRER